MYTLQGGGYFMPTPGQMPMGAPGGMVGAPGMMGMQVCISIHEALSGRMRGTFCCPFLLFHQALSLFFFFWRARSCENCPEIYIH